MWFEKLGCRNKAGDQEVMGELRLEGCPHVYADLGGLVGLCSCLGLNCFSIYDIVPSSVSSFCLFKNVI